MEDDDMIVVVIGDEAVTRAEKDSKLNPFIKEAEPFDDLKIAESELDLILERVTKHGKYIELKQLNQQDAVQFDNLSAKIPVKKSKNCDNSDSKKSITIKRVEDINKHIKTKIQRRDGRNSRLYCKQCPASFKFKTSLIAHNNSHEGLRPYQCETCPAAYTSEVALKNHQQTHSDSLFICDHCQSSFKFKKVLKQHMDTHQPLRKYPCEYCPRRFAQKSALHHHQNKVHLNLPPAHACPVCPKRFSRMSLVRDHMTKAHGLSMITRKMFFGNLPTLTDLNVVKPAKIVF